MYVAYVPTAMITVNKCAWGANAPFVEAKLGLLGWTGELDFFLFVGHDLD